MTLRAWNSPTRSTFAAAPQPESAPEPSVDCTPLELLESGTTDAFDMLLRPPGDLFRPLDSIEVWVDEAQRAGLHPDFQGFTLRELSATGMLITARKMA